jgi:hypothetical protein
MKPLFKVLGTVAAGNLVCFWIFYGLLMAARPHTGLGQFMGIELMPAPSLPFLLWGFVILGAPCSVLLDGTGGDYFVLHLVLSSLLNSIIWGVCLGYAIYAIIRRFRPTNQMQ